MSDPGCQHLNITTWYIASGEHFGEPSGLWSCVNCSQKFYPASELDQLRAKLQTAQARIAELELQVADLQSKRLLISIDDVLREAEKTG